ncbi:hypothetical protein [Gluconacetobacter tumulisoli]|uniref:Uncharacterized protein n=1 Tax=Gluconacetobacter tumulisoli TaxID=1286189 RepID=A0A7W4PQ81_9PROT|nr:hypothetical protein [Gluconacetobacter tumulisoli]MBB2202571.1 hypothetical protein [Gluconacetobacter tumulisoli]
MPTDDVRHIRSHRPWSVLLLGFASVTTGAVMVLPAVFSALFFLVSPFPVGAILHGTTMMFVVVVELLFGVPSLISLGRSFREFAVGIREHSQASAGLMTLSVFGICGAGAMFFPIFHGVAQIVFLANLTVGLFLLGRTALIVCRGSEDRRSRPDVLG